MVALGLSRDVNPSALLELSEQGEDMKRMTMLVDGVPYALTGGQDLTAVKDAFVDASRGGGNFVAIELSDTKIADVFVTATRSIMFLSEDVAEVDDDDGYGDHFSVPSLVDYLG